jgi:hypothetical protein
MMHVRIASRQAPDRAVNEDYGFAGGGLVGVLDGVTEAPGRDNGCIHGTAWYVRRLGAHLVRANGNSAAIPLTDVLAEAITATRGDHEGRCRLDEPSTPAATVCLLRQRGSEVDYLVLCDTTLVIDHRHGIETITDVRFRDTIARLRRGDPSMDDPTSRNRQITPAKWDHINRDGGYWIAASNPDAAYHALTGTVTCGEDGIRRAALLTDGASCAVDTFGILDWPQLLDLLTDQGPVTLIEQVRAAEKATITGSSHIKRHDDATAAICLFPGSRP